MADHAEYMRAWRRRNPERNRLNNIANKARAMESPERRARINELQREYRARHRKSTRVPKALRNITQFPALTAWLSRASACP